MAMSDSRSTPLDRPGGETCAKVRMRPIDLHHLSRQTLGDRSVEQEVLMLFLQQANLVKDRFAVASAAERVRLAHGLRGSALGVGAFPIADWASGVEAHPDGRQFVRSLSRLIDEVRDFIAAVNR